MDWDFKVKNDTKDTTEIAVIVILVIIGIIVGPLLTLLALNTLFPVLAIPYTFWTWLATFFLLAVTRGKVNKK
jgi:hypothetical protein